MTRILIIADDLTGALNSAVAFAGRGLRTLVVRQADDIAAALAREPQVVALATGSRELSVAEAVRRVEAMTTLLARWADIVFKKVNSRLKGHIVAETAAVARLAGLDRVVVAPAIPDFGRVVRNGHLHGHGIDRPLDIAALLDGLALPHAIPDVDRQADFAPALAAAGRTTLLVGARGLAAALAEQLAGAAGTETGPLHAPLLIAIGSRDPITLAQVAAIGDVAAVQAVAAPNGNLPPTAPTGPVVLAQMVPGLPAIDSAMATAAFASGLAALAGTMRPATLFASGGETAESLLAQWGVGLLEVRGELLPGIPVSDFEHGDRRTTLITKSGGFGPPDTLMTLMERMDR